MSRSRGPRRLRVAAATPPLPVDAPPRSAAARAQGPLPRADGPPAEPPFVLVVGLGNPILGDDGVGWHVADGVEARLAPGRCDVRVERAALGGLALMERLVGARRAILIDATETGAAQVGTVTCLPLEDVGCRAAGHLDSVHDAPLTVALAAGRALGADLPVDVSVVSVEARRLDTFDEHLSPAVAAAVPAAVAAVMGLLDL